MNDGPNASSSGAEADAGAVFVQYPPYVAFDESITDQCLHGRQSQTSVGMQGDALILEDCANRKRAGLERRLPRSVAGTTTQQASLRRESCFIQDLLGWSHDGFWSYGTNRPVDFGISRSTQAINHLYFIDALKNQKVAEYSGYVAHHQSKGALAMTMLEKIRERSVTYAGISPEEPGAKNACPSNCVMSDADWRQVRRIVEHLNGDATAVAESRCSNWPELQASLGGKERCNDQLRLLLVAESGAAGDMIDPAPRAPQAILGFWKTGKLDDGTTGTPKSFSEFSPAKESTYAQFANDIYERCEPLFRDVGPDRAMNMCFYAELSSRFHTLAERVPSSSAFLAKWKGFAHELCAVEADAAYAFGESAQNLPGDPSCSWRAAVQGAFLVESWSTAAPGDFLEHEQYRQPWAEGVLRGIERLKTRAASRPCKPNEYPPDVECRTDPSSPMWQKVTPDLEKWTRACRELAQTLCQTWPELAAMAGSDCHDITERFLESLSNGLGQLPRIGEPHN